MAQSVPRLLEAIVPQTYQLDFDINLTDFSYVVQQTIRFKLTGSSDKLKFHATHLQITDASLESDIAATSISFDEQAQIVTFNFDEPVPAGEHDLSFVAKGEINDSLHGFYRSQYDSDGTPKWLATTQFEAIHAREAFVCIDEPAAKAVFEISITTEAELTVLSNTNVSREITLADDRIKRDFSPTPRMSTYLVAFIVGELEAVHRRTPEGINVNVYATPGKKDQLDFALDTACRSLSFYGEYFGQNYPLPKLDMVAIPDFASGAMENWGLVTYRETALMLDEQSASLGNRQRVAEVVAHELAHQWFGNLVTMSWWDDLWLNEGFASWAEVLAQDHLFPEWNIWTQFVSDHVAHALQLDSLANTHPIEVKVEDPRALDEIFDAVSYSKGAAIINMLHRYLGAEAFQHGLQTYLKRHAYSNTTTRDLWQALAEASGQPVAAVMTAWTTQPGYPIITLVPNGEDIQVTQERFYASSLEAQTSTPAVWPVPLVLSGPDIETTTLVKNDDQVETPAGGLIKANAGQSGFYRIRYDQSSINRLMPLLTARRLDVTDRFGVIDDIAASTEAGLTGSGIMLGVIAALRQEPNYTVWQALSGGFASLLNIVEDEHMRGDLEKFGNWLVTPNLKRLGWSPHADEAYFDSLLRPVILQQAIRYGDEATIQTACSHFAERRDNPIPADLRDVVYYAIARTGDQKSFEELLEMYRRAQIPQERMRLLMAICRFRDQSLIERTLQLTFSDDVRAQDSIFVIAGSLVNRDARMAAWAFIKANWQTMLERYGEGGHMLEYVPLYVSRAFASDEMADEITAFFAANPHPSISRPAAQAIESIRLKAAWYNRDKKLIESFLADRSSHR